MPCRRSPVRSRVLNSARSSATPARCCLHLDLGLSAIVRRRRRPGASRTWPLHHHAWGGTTVGMWPPGTSPPGSSRSRIAPSTRSVYERDMAAAVAWLDEHGVIDPAAVGRRTLRAYLADLDRSGYARRTIAQGIGASPLLRLGATHGRVESDPSAALTAPKGTANLPTVLTAAEIDGLLEGRPERWRARRGRSPRSSGRRVALRQWDPGK